MAHGRVGRCSFVGNSLRKLIGIPLAVEKRGLSVSLQRSASVSGHVLIDLHSISSFPYGGVTRRFFGNNNRHGTSNNGLLYDVRRTRGVTRGTVLTFTSLLEWKTLYTYGGKGVEGGGPRENVEVVVDSGWWWGRPVLLNIIFSFLCLYPVGRGLMGKVGGFLFTVVTVTTLFSFTTYGSARACGSLHSHRLSSVDSFLHRRGIGIVSRRRFGDH